MSDVRLFLERLGLGTYAPKFEKQQVSFGDLLMLSDSDLRELGLPLGPRKRLLDAISRETRYAGAVGTSEDAEQRQLTVLMCDIVGSTKLIQKLGAERTHELIQNYRMICESTMLRYEGQIQQWEGDGLLAYFGYPVAHEDDAERAVHSALEICRRVPQMGLASNSDVQCRIGIATGEVIVKPLTGLSAAEQGSTLGEAPNLAKRLQEFAAPSSIAVCASTRKLIKYGFTTTGPEIYSAEGFRNVRVWTISGLRSGALRFHKSRQLTPLVARERELANLADWWQKCLGGSGATVLLEGEAGVGKSRLADTLDSICRRSRAYRVRCQCSQLYSASALRPLVEVLHRMTRSSHDQQDLSDGYRRLQQLLASVSSDLEKHTALLADLAGLPGRSEGDESDLSGYELKELTFRAIVAVLTEMSHKRPTFLLVEDVHWADATTLELLERLLPLARKSRLLIVLTRRTGYKKLQWENQLDACSTVAPLGIDESRQLILGITGGGKLSDDVLESIVHKSSGNPLTIEEFTKTALAIESEDDESADVKAISLPTSLRSSLLARIDRLAISNRMVRQLVQTASAVIRDFPLALISNVMDQEPTELSRLLNTLVQSGIFVVREGRLESRYSFSHALLHDAVYDSLLHGQKRRLHQRIADTLEGQYPETCRFEPELLARHFAAADKPEKSISYWRQAGVRAKELAANQEAVHHFEAGLKLLANFEQEATWTKVELELQLELAEAARAAWSTSTPIADAAYQRAFELGDTLGHVELTSHAIYGRFAVAFQSADLQNAQSVAEQLLNVGLSTGIESVLATGYQACGICSFVLGSLPDARSFLVQAVNKVDDIGLNKDLQYAQFPFTSQSYLTWTYFLLGENELAEIECSKMLTTSASGTSFERALSLSNACTYFQMSGQPSAVENCASELLEHADRNGLPAWQNLGTFFLGWVHANRDSGEKGIAMMREADVISDRVEAPYFRATLSERLFSTGLVDEALNEIELALTVIEQTGERWYEPEALRLKATYLKDLHTEDKLVEEVLDQARRIAQKLGTRAWLERMEIDSRLQSR